MKLWTLMILCLSPLPTCPMYHQASILGLRSWYFNSVKMFQYIRWLKVHPKCPCYLWILTKILLTTIFTLEQVSSLTPSWPHLSCYHVTSHLNSPSKNVTSHLTVISQEISNYNILLATIPTIKDTQFKKRKYNSTLIIKSPHKDKPKNWQKSCPFLHLQNCQKDPSCPVSRCSPFPPYVLLAATWSTGSPGGDCLRSVSYTHLTLPTILRV